MIKVAVILAAGIGSRFKEKALDRPKCFIDFLDRPMIIRSVENLIQSGIEKIIIGTGHQSEWFEKLQIDYPQIVCYKINTYASTGSLFTLFSCKHLINTDFLLLESDIVYEEQSLKSVINNKDKNVVLATSLIKFQDQFYVETNNQLQLVNCSFDKAELNKIDGEWVGVNKISIETYKEICEIIKKNPSEYKKKGYEKMFISDKLNSRFYVKHIPNLLWYEIDAEEDLIEAERIFLEKIIQIDF